MRTLYEVLGLATDADEQSIKAAYRTLARRLHPDLNASDTASAQRLAEVNHAYATLGNLEARAAYDQDLARRRTETHRLYSILAASSVVTFVATAALVSFAVRWHLEAPGAAKTPDALARSPLPGAMHVSRDGAGPNPPPHPTGAASWTSYRDKRFEFALRYPASIFAYDATQSGANVQTFVSRDGRAVLRIVAVDNPSGITLGSFRRTLMKERYAGAAFDQAPQRQHWFALSGTHGDEVFFERVTFSCDGKSMHGWQMRYPSSERATYDELARLVLRNHPHGNGPGAGCRDARGKSQAQPQARQKRG